MRILHVIESLGVGGTEQMLVKLLPQLAATGHTSDIAVLWPPYDLEPVIAAYGVQVHRLGISNRWNLIQARRRLSDIVARNKYEVIHARLSFSAIYTAILPRSVSGPVRVVSFHNLAYVSHPAVTPARKARRALEGWLLRNRIDGCIAISRAVALHYSEHLGVPLPLVIGNSISGDEMEFGNTSSYAMRRRFGLQPEDFIIASPGRLVPDKGYRYLLAAMAQLAERDIRAKLLIIGNGPLEGDLRDTARGLGIGELVHFLPSLPHSDLFPLVQASDLYATATVSEGFGLATLEAMSLGVPVLATRVGGLLDFIEDGVTGRLVAPADSGAFATALEELISNPALRAELGAAGRRYVLSNHTVERNAEQLVSFYQSIQESSRFK